MTSPCAAVSARPVDATTSCKRTWLVSTTIAMCEVLALLAVSGAAVRPVGRLVGGMTIVGTARAATTKPVSPKPCALISRAQASIALGQPVAKPVLGKAEQEGATACVFYGPHVPKGARPNIQTDDTVRVALVGGAGATRWFTWYRSSVTPQTVYGFGNQAFYDGYLSLNVLQGGYYLRIAVIGVTNNLAGDEMLMRDALAKL